MTTLTGPTATKVPFSAVLRDRTRDVHDLAEQSPFVGALLAEQLERAEYAQLLAQLQVVYEALEAAAETLRKDPVVGPFVSDDVVRGPALDADLRYLIGDDWRAVAPPTAAALRYRDRIVEVGATWPGGFLAHHYTRYMGDLSGGLIVGATVRRAYDLPGPDGVRFHTFDAISHPGRFKRDYRALLDDVPWGIDERLRVVDEARRALRLNTAVFTDLERRRVEGVGP